MERDIDHLCVTEHSPFLEVLQKQCSARSRGLPAGIVLVVDGDGRLMGTITDGDVRRAFLENPTGEIRARDMMQEDPICFHEALSFGEILERLPRELEKRNRRARKFLGKIVFVDDENRPVRALDYHRLWEQRVATHRHVVVAGLGYVGLTLALVLAEEGFLVTGVDIDRERLEALNRGDSYVHETGISELLREQIGRNFTATGEMPDSGDVYIIAVGTPVRPDASGRPVPVMDDLVGVAEQIGARLRPGNLVILRSTVPVGATRGEVLPVLERASGLEAGKDFHLAFAPERTAEGKAIQELRELPQIIGGLNRDSAEATVALFRELTHVIVRVESLEGAEMAKLINNTFRDFVFSYSNYVAQLASHFNLDVVEVINAANQGYPRHQVPLPSPGVGGPCLTKDPYIFATVAEALKHDDSLFAHGRRVNESMHGHVVDSLLRQLEAVGKDPRNCEVLVCGLAFKGDPETGDIRNSSALVILELLRDRVGSVTAHDPVAAADEIRALGIEPEELPGAFGGKDAVLFLNNHRTYRKLDVFEMTRAMAPKPVVLDGWSLFRPQDILHAAPSVYMGLSFAQSSIDRSHPEIRST